MSKLDIAIVRPYSIVLGPYANGTSTYEWTGIKNIKWEDVSPWVHTDIPHGPMLHQHLRSPHVTGYFLLLLFKSMAGLRNFCLILLLKKEYCI